MLIKVDFFVRGTEARRASAHPPTSPHY
jgi:hypothetical protein